MSSSNTQPKPLITHIYTADPSAHSFNNRIYIYPSHDRETAIKFNDNGDQYDMTDYHVLSLSDPTSINTDNPVTDHGIALHSFSIPWVSKQLWAPDCAYSSHTKKYYLYFPARDKEGIFRIGVAESEVPEGPFEPDESWIEGTYSIDPAAFVDDDGEAYLYFGGLWGGQLQCWQGETGEFDASLQGPNEPVGDDVPALSPRVAKLSPDMHTLASPSTPVQILAPETKLPIPASDHTRRFFEAAWMHKHNSLYYFSYSTGDTHLLAYATGTSPLGPFTYRGTLLEPVLGWTTHHSIVEHRGRWWLFYHDCELSGGVDHLRSVKVREIVYDGDLMKLAEPQ